MAQAEFRRLAEGGLAEFPPDDLSRLARASKQRCFDTGDVRFCILSDIARLLDDFYESREPVQWSWQEQLSKVLADALPPVLDADPDSARRLALTLLHDIRAVIAGL